MWGQVSAAVAVAFGLAMMATAALAGTPGTSPGNGSFVGGVTFPGPEPLVLWNLPGSGGKLGTCIDASVNGPLTGPYQRRSSINDPLYAELNHLYANSATSDVRLAELSAINSAKYDQVDKSAQWGYVLRGEGGLSVADATAMSVTAKNLAGPYTVSVSWPPADTAVNVAYQATITVRSASGHVVPGASVSLAGTNLTLASTSVTTNSAGVATAGFTIGAGTSSTATMTASVPEWLTLDVYQSNGEQTMLTTGAASAAHGAYTAPVSRTRDVRLVKVAKGDATHTPVPGYIFSVVAADGTVMRQSVTSGTSPVSLGDLPVGATYTVTETGTPAGGSLYIPPDASIDFTVPSGTGQWTVEFADPAKPTPSLHTQVSPTHALVGQRLVDHVTVSGDDGELGTITAKLFGPVRPPRSGQCSDVSLTAFHAAPTVVVTATAHGNGVVDVVGPVVTATGCYGWAESLALAPSGVVVTSPPTAPNESALVTNPAVHTTASAAIALPGTRLHDSVVVSGLGTVPATLAAVLYGPLPASPLSGCTGYSAAAWQHAAEKNRALAAGHARMTIHGNGTYDIGAVTMSRTGCYTWVEVLAPDAAGVQPIRTPYGQASESTVVVSPAIGTVASPSRLRPGGAVRDVVTVVGTSAVGSTITGRLLGPVAPVNGSCAGVDWSKAPVAGVIKPLPVPRDGRYVTAPITVTVPGCYTFSEVLVSVTAPPIPLAVTPAGQPAETVLARSPAIPLARTGVPVGSSVIAGLVLLGLGGFALALGSLRRRAL